jgi:hypothetical protein
MVIALAGVSLRAAMNSYSSAQEAILGPLMARALVTPFVFAPDDWKKGSGTREPADLVWACNNCVILVHMQEKKEQVNSQRAVRVRDDAIRHNLAQLKGWLKHWRKGQALTGRNGHARFAIPYSDDFHVISLSVIKCAQAECRAHPDVAAELGIAHCATLAQPVIEALAQIGGSTLDFVTLIRDLEGIGTLTPAGALAWVSEYRKASFLESGAERLWPGGVTDDRFSRTASYVFGARNPSPNGRNSLITHPARIPEDLEGLLYLNDRTLRENLTAISGLQLAFDAVLANKILMLSGIINLDRYDQFWSVVYGLTYKALEFWLRGMHRISEACEKRQDHSLIMLHVDLHAGVGVLAVKPRRGPSSLSQLLTLPD